MPPRSARRSPTCASSAPRPRSATALRVHAVAATGTHRGRLARAARHRPLRHPHGLHYVELADGRISRARGFFDLYERAIQLGLLPARGGLGETALLLLRGFGLRR